MNVAIDFPPISHAVEWPIIFGGDLLGVNKVVLLASAAIWGSKGAWSALVAIAVVTVNLVLSALALAWAARTSPTALMATALGGFLVRMGLVTLVVVAVRHQPWIDLPALAIAILATHLGLLFWEMRYVGATLAFPGVKPPQTGA